MVFPVFALSPVLTSIIGKEALLEGSKALVSSSTSILSRTHPDLDKIMEELDLKNSIGQIHTIIEDITPFINARLAKFFKCIDNIGGTVDTIQSYKCRDGNSYGDGDSNGNSNSNSGVDLHDEFSSLVFAIKSLEEIVKKIDVELADIEKDIEEHKLKWFTGWRSSNHEIRIPNLLRLKDTLDKRIDNLVKVVQLRNIIVDSIKN